MVWIYTLISVLIVSLLSFVGVFTLSVDQKKLYKYLIYLVSLAAGTLLGEAFFHLIPEAYENENKVFISFSLLLGILIFFVMEKVIHWRHCHEKACEEHPHPFSYIILVGDGIHNFIDGLIIGASYLVSIPVGIATTVAVIFHEIPQEVGDFGSLVYGGLKPKKALFFNFASGLLALLGALIILWIGINVESAVEFLVPLAAGGFIYIAGTDLIPELHKHKELKQAIFQTIAFICGIALMFAMLWLE
jgi:zinc and cadmium transporter